MAMKGTDEESQPHAAAAISGRARE